MSRRLRISAPPPTLINVAGFDLWAHQITDAVNLLPNFSISSTSNGPNSYITGDSGTLLIDVGSSATTYWAKLSGITTSGWTELLQGGGAGGSATTNAASLTTGSLAWERLPISSGSWVVGAGTIAKISTGTLEVVGNLSAGTTTLTGNFKLWDGTTPMIQTTASVGRIGIGTAPGSFTLAIGGDKTIEFTGASAGASLVNDAGGIAMKAMGATVATFFDSQIRFADGSAGGPVFTFANETTLGLWRSAAGILKMQGKLDVTDIVTLNAPVTLKGYTVATLPTGVQGHMAFVTDALAPTFLVAAVGGGAVVAPVFYNGAAWVTC